MHIIMTYQIIPCTGNKTVFQFFYILLLSIQIPYSYSCVQNFQNFPEFPTKTFNPAIKIEPHCKDSSFSNPESHLLDAETTYEIEVQVQRFSQLKRKSCWWFFHVEPKKCLPRLTCSKMDISQNTGCSRSNLEIYDGENEKTRYCGILLPGASLQHSSTIFPTEFPNIQGFDIRFTDDLGLSQMECKIECAQKKTIGNDGDDDVFVEVQNKCPVGMACINNDENKNTVMPVKCTCGMPFSRRIVGGMEAGRNSIPWQVAILYNNHLDCGGTLIAPSYVITAAHCVLDGKEKSKLSLLLGRHNLASSALLEEGHQKRNVKTIHQHPTFSLETFDYDFAILEMDEPYDTTEFVYPACLPDSASNKYERIRVNVSGWGSLDGEVQMLPDKLQIVELTTLDHGECGMLKGMITNNMLCAGGKNGKDACQGDSGGPLTTMEEGTSSYTVVGVVSFGIGCGRDDFPGVYSRVTSVLDWIKDTISDSNCGRN